LYTYLGALFLLERSLSAELYLTKTMDVSVPKSGAETFQPEARYKHLQGCLSNLIRDTETHYIPSSHIGLIRCLTPLGVRAIICILTLCNKVGIPMQVSLPHKMHYRACMLLEMRKSLCFVAEVSSELGSTSSGAGAAVHELQKTTAGGRLEVA